MATQLLTGLTTVAAFKAFWSDYASYSLSDGDIQSFIDRATILISNYGRYNVGTSDSRFAIAANLLARRLVYADKHPFASAEPAGVRGESSRGVSYTSVDRYNPEPRSLKNVLGEEITNILDGLADETFATMSLSTIVFPETTVFTRMGGETTNVFDEQLDEGFARNAPISERATRGFTTPVLPWRWDG